MIAAAANTENTITWRSGQRKSSKQNQVSQNNISVFYKLSRQLFFYNTLKDYAEFILMSRHGTISSSYLLLETIIQNGLIWGYFWVKLYFMFRFWETQPLVSVGKPPPDWQKVQICVLIYLIKAPGSAGIIFFFPCKCKNQVQGE